jgi:hypothetical protein
MHLRYGTSLLSTPGQLGPVLLPYGSKNYDEEHCFLKFSIELAFWQTVVCNDARSQVRRSRLKLPREKKIARLRVWLFKCMLASENKFCNLEMRLPDCQPWGIHILRAHNFGFLIASILLGIHNIAF